MGVSSVSLLLDDVFTSWKLQITCEFWKKFSLFVVKSSELYLSLAWIIYMKIQVKYTFKNHYLRSADALPSWQWQADRLPTCHQPPWWHSHILTSFASTQLWKGNLCTISPQPLYFTPPPVSGPSAKCYKLLCWNSVGKQEGAIIVTQT